ncbi:MAG TPA: hypothetical protein VEG31_00785, partial [Thermoproteota archaeon]|nr:hypothetical protein [Thermoproteota archaeon]
MSDGGTEPETARDEPEEYAERRNGSSVESLWEVVGSLGDLKEQNTDLQSKIEKAQRKLAEAQNRMTFLEEKYESLRRSQLKGPSLKGETKIASEEATGRSFWSRV